MSRLIKTEFLRLLKYKPFLICMLLPSLYELYEVLSAMKLINNIPEEMTASHSVHADSELLLFNNGHQMILLCVAVFVGLFVSSQHGGALRNKLIMGYSRICVYFSELAVCTLGTVMIYLLFTVSGIAAICISGGILREEFLYSVLFHLGFIFLSVIGMCALFTAQSMLVSTKVIGAIISLVTVIVFGLSQYTFISSGITRLQSKYEGVNSYYSVQMYTGGEITFRAKKSPDIPADTGTEIMRTVEQLLPFGQIEKATADIVYSFVLQNYDLDNDIFYEKPHDYESGFSADVAVCGSLCFLVISTAAGMLIFRRKDIK